MIRRCLFHVCTVLACLEILLVAPALAAPNDEPRAFDAAPFGISEVSQDGRGHGVRWGKSRKIRKVVVEFDENAEVPDPNSVRLQYWLGSWNGTTDVDVAEAPSARGWLPMDDWTNGKWHDADVRLHTAGHRWTYTFAPSGAKEFPDLGTPGVAYRKTLKIRLVSDQPLPKPALLQTLTEAVCRPLKVRVLWGTPAAPEIKIGEKDPCRVEVFNGVVKAVRTLPGSNFVVDKGMRWTLPKAAEGGIELDLITAYDRSSGEYDRTIVTIRSKDRPFSFAAAEVAGGRRILVDDLGVLVVSADDPVTLAECRRERKEQSKRTVYDRVFQRSEQSLSSAWNDMPRKFPLWFVHGLPGNRNAVKHYPNGDLAISSVRQWFNNVDRSTRDSARKDWPGDFLSLGFGFPKDSLRGGRALQQGYLPLLRTWWVDGPIYYEQRAILDKLDGDLSEFRLDDPTLLLMKVRLVNTSATESGTAHLHLTSGSDQLVLQGDRMMTRGDKPRFRYLMRSRGPAKTAQVGGGVRWSVDLAPGESRELFFAIPTITLASQDELEALRNRTFGEAAERLGRMWKELADRGTQIQTPEPWLNHFYRAHIRHLEINCVKDLKATWRYPRVATFGYAVFPNESVMMTADLDRRGHPKLVEDCLDSWLEYQGTVMLPGNFKSSEGLFYGSGGWEHVGYNKHHGCIMWGLADHWRITRDRRWMKRVAAKLVKACDWVTRERQATMQLKPNGSKPLEYGFLPAGGLEDVQDYWYWVATNTATVWGFDALASALADYGHPEAARLQRDARAYHEDVFRGITEARILAPVVRLRDGTYVPKFPSRLYQRGRSLGWIRETLEGAMYLIYNGLIPADSLEATWILKDYEDNLFISRTYGYDIPNFSRFWLSRGGFSMQANLLECPAVYLERDQIKHFVRAYFNGFTSAFYPSIMMCNEHCKPELGYPAGDHFKTSDEANITTWLRLMFVREEGDTLYLGQGIPRYWLAGGRTISIRNAPTYFGRVSLEISSTADERTITALVTPPKRDPPRTTRLRIRHPGSKPLRTVTLNGQKYDRFDAAKEWIEIPVDSGTVQEIVGRY